MIPPAEPPDSEPDAKADAAIALDPALQTAIDRLYRLTIYGRWLTVTGLWLTVGAASLWGLRYPITLLQQHFTWSAVRYGLANNPIPAIGLGLCIGLTLAILLWQSRNIVFGLHPSEQTRLHKAVTQIQQQGQTHPLWKWVWANR
jgi:hypothetical protein